MARLGYVQLTRRCQQDCRFCSNPPAGLELSEPRMRALLGRIGAMGYDGAILTGGEPTTSPLLFPALAECRRLGLRCRMITNGRRLADPGFFRRCVRAGLSHVHLSLHSHRPELHDFLTRSPGSWDALTRALALVPEMGITADLNCVINTYNAGELDLGVLWILRRFPFVRHFVWNNMDPDGNRAEQNPDCIPRLHELRGSLDRALRLLHRTGRSFRVERVPLCAMPRFPWASTETRKIVKEEERCVGFLDDRGFVRQTRFVHRKAEVCAACRLDPVCAGLHSMGRHHDEEELSPVFEDPVRVIRRVLGRDPPAELVEWLLAGAGRRSASS